MAVNLINSNDIEVEQTGENIQLKTTVDIQTLETDVQNLKDGEQYSENEILTSEKWINNKPIYRKIISSPVQTTIAHNISNLDEFVSIIAIAYNSNSGKWFSIPSTRPSYSNYEIGIFADNTNISLEIGSSVPTTTMNIKVILEYTKIN